MHVVTASERRVLRRSVTIDESCYGSVFEERRTCRGDKTSPPARSGAVFAGRQRALRPSSGRAAVSQSVVTPCLRTALIRSASDEDSFGMRTRRPPLSRRPRFRKSMLEGERRELKEGFVWSKVAIVRPSNETDDATMFDHDSLGAAGRPGGIHDVREVRWTCASLGIFFGCRGALGLIIDKNNLARVI